MLSKDAKKAETVDQVKQLVSDIEKMLNNKVDQILEAGVSDDFVQPENWLLVKAAFFCVAKENPYSALDRLYQKEFDRLHRITPSATTTK